MEIPSGAIKYEFFLYRGNINSSSPIKAVEVVLDKYTTQRILEAIPVVEERTDGSRDRVFKHYSGVFVLYEGERLDEGSYNEKLTTILFPSSGRILKSRKRTEKCAKSLVKLLKKSGLASS